MQAVLIDGWVRMLAHARCVALMRSPPWLLRYAASKTASAAGKLARLVVGWVLLLLRPAQMSSLSRSVRTVGSYEAVSEVIENWQ